MNNQLPPIDDFIDDEITESDFKVALTRLHAYLTEAVGANGENITAAVTVNVTGSGNAVTGLSANGSAITATKGTSFVPATRTVNGKSLSGNVVLGVTDIEGAMKVDVTKLGVGAIIVGKITASDATNNTSHDGGLNQCMTSGSKDISTVQNILVDGSKLQVMGETFTAASDMRLNSGSARYATGTWRYIGSKTTATCQEYAYNVSNRNQNIALTGYFQRVS